MRYRPKIIAVLMLLFAGSTLFFIVQKYYPYVFPDGVCFTRNGVAIGDRKSCMEATNAGLEQTAMYPKLSGVKLPVDRCKKRCLRHKKCSYYMILEPITDKRVFDVNREARSCMLFD